MSRARDFADLADSADAGGLTGRNLIINGAMQVAQRGTSTSSVSSGFTYPAVDRLGFNVNNGGTWTVSQSTDTPSGQGFGNSFKLDCTSADTSLGAADFIQAKMRIEANTLQGLAYNTSSAKNTTLSFWVKSAKTGTYIVEWLNEDASNKHIAKTYTIDSANTWEKKELTIPGDTAGVINNDTGKGMELTWWLGAGSNFTSSTLQTSWGALDQTARAAGVVNLADSTSNDWYITGIQWEVGEVATPFEHRSFGEELQLCRRYFTRYTGNTVFTVGQAISTSQASASVPLQQPMRVAPTKSQQGIKMRNSTGNSADASALSIANKTTDFIELLGTRDGSGLTAGDAVQFRVNTTSDFLDFDAEL